MAHSITIRPIDNAWVVSAKTLGADLFFFSGGRAEATARGLAKRMARAGQAAEVEIVLRNGVVAGRFHYPALLAA
jgi:hypothetical protein